MYISTLVDCGHYIKRRWWRDFPQSLFLPKYVKTVLLANNTVLNFHKEKHGEQRSCWSWSIQIFVGQYLQFPMEVNDISSPSLMIIVGRFGFIFCRKILKLLKPSGALKHLLKKTSGNPIKSFARIMVANTTPQHLQIFVRNMALRDNSLQLIHHNRMASANGRIAPF